MRRWRERQEPKVTQAALGRDVGVSGSYIRKYESGERDLPIRVRLAIHDRTGIPIEHLLGVEEMEEAARVAGLLKRDTGEDDPPGNAAAAG